MKITTIVAHTIDELDPESWDRLVDRLPFTSRRWLSYCEAVYVNDLPIYLIVVEDGEWVGGAVFWLRRQPTLPDIPQFAEKALGWVFRIRPLLVCEIPIAGCSGLILPEDTGSRDRALRTILDQAEELSQMHSASFVVFGYLHRSLDGEEAWQGRYSGLQLFPTAEMDISAFNDYSEYLAQRTKKERKNIRRNREAALAQGAVVRRGRTIDLDRAEKLAENVARRHGGYLQRELRLIFEHAGMVDGTWLKAEVDGELVGFDLLLGDGDHWKVQATGSDYSADRVYFLLSDEDVRFAIEVNASRLIGGTHLYRVKERLGYKVMTDGLVRFAGKSPAARLLSAVLLLRQKPPGAPG